MTTHKVSSKEKKQISEHARMVKRYHTLCTRLNMGHKHKEMILESFGVESSLDLTIADLQAICTELDKQLNPKPSQTDKWRKRVMAAIGGWLRLVRKEQNAEIIKAIACRATGYKHFDEIPKARLANLYAAFVHKQNDFKTVGHIAKEEMDLLASLN